MTVVLASVQAGAAVGALVGAGLAAVVLVTQERMQRQRYGPDLKTRESYAQAQIFSGGRPEGRATGPMEYGCAVVVIVGLCAAAGALVGAIL